MKFLLGAATAAHQVEGNNKNSDFWIMENMKYSDFDEPSLDAVDHYHRYKEDIDLLKKAGLNAYRFSVEWARIEPVEGKFDMEEENVEDRNAMNMKRKANEINPGTATAYHIVRFGDKYAIVFFVFDSNRIKEAKVATAKNEKSRSYSCVTIPGFNKIKPSDYTK